MNGGAGVARIGPAGSALCAGVDERLGERAQAGRWGVCRFARVLPMLNPGYLLSDRGFLFAPIGWNRLRRRWIGGLAFLA
jgi:hypothetical protein